MLIESSPDDLDLGPEHYEMDPDDCPDMDEEFEPWDEPVDGAWLVSMVMGLDIAFSVSEIENVLREPKKVLNGINQKTIVRLEELAYEKLPKYPETGDDMRDGILDCAADDAGNIPWLQCLTLYHAVDFFYEFRTIACDSEEQFAKFVFAFASANWWSARWKELVKEYGDRTVDFLV